THDREQHQDRQKDIARPTHGGTPLEQMRTGPVCPGYAQMPAGVTRPYSSGQKGMGSMEVEQAGRGDLAVPSVGAER
ncbi:MAG: hypothetical protein MUE60_10860, partial [Candidatus Eisenbacteria bacterium]|nr:hypothetical protein [Candidatus Eisenbacteria bacterium]